MTWDVLVYVTVVVWWACTIHKIRKIWFTEV